MLSWPAHIRKASHRNSSNRSSQEKTSVVAVGPGLGQSPAVVELLNHLIADSTLPLVTDADALNVLAAHPDLLAKLGKSGKNGRNPSFSHRTLVRWRVSAAKASLRFKYRPTAGRSNLCRKATV